MDSTLAIALGWGIAAVAFFSFLSVSGWAQAREREREAYYRSEAIKKVAEMQGAVPESVLELLKGALTTPTAAPNKWTASPGVIRQYYKNETLKRVAELKGGAADGVLAVMREEERRAALKVREGLKLGGLIAVGVGAGLMIYLRQLVGDKPVYLAGLIPLFVGAAMLIYVFLLAPPVEA